MTNRIRNFFLLVYLITCADMSSQGCRASFTYLVDSGDVKFFNKSIIANAHYYWNFGDGTTSIFKNPLHKFPENGTYLVTLYINDTIANCSDHFDQWLTIYKTSTDSCTPFISDSIFSYNGSNYVKIIDQSMNCKWLKRTFSSIGTANVSSTTFKFRMSGNYVSKVRYFKGGASFERNSYKTSSFNFNRSKNYSPCSSNFEFRVVSQNDTLGQRILFTAMNKNASSYKWTFIGFGNPQYYSSDTISVFYTNFFLNARSSTAWNVRLRTVDKDGCIDSLEQHISVLKTENTIPLQVKENTNSELKIKLYPNPTKDIIHIEFENSVASDRISIVNMLGQHIMEIKKPLLIQKIDISLLPKGVYFLKAENLQGQSVFKVVKE